MKKGRGGSVRRRTGWKRSLLLAGLGAVSMWLLTACDPDATTFTVNSDADRVDANPGDGACETTTPGECTLRAAVMEANLDAGGDTVALADGHIYALTLPGAGEDAGATGDLDITQNLTIQGRATIDGSALDRVFDVRTGTLTLQSATVTGGVSSNGGGLRVATGAGLAASAVEITENASWGGIGGIYATNATINLTGSAITDNDGTTGGALRTAGPLTVTTSTISGNTTDTGTGGIQNQSATPASLTAVTISHNTGTTGGITGPATATATVIGDNTGPDCATAITSGGYNADSDNTCLAAPTTGDQPGADPEFGALSPNGGATNNRLPAPTSSLIDAIPAGVAGCGVAPTWFDQRLAVRPIDSDLTGGAACEIGATEAPAPTGINHGGDSPDSDPGDGYCQDRTGVPGACSLRAAIGEANGHPGADTVTIPPSIDTITLTVAGTGEDANQTGDLDVSGTLTIDGNGATVDADGLDRVLDVKSGAFTLDHTTLTGGTALAGGGLSSATGTTTTVTDSVITGNTSTGLFNCQIYTLEIVIPFGCTGGGGGAGISATGTLHLDRSTVSANHAVGGGCIREFGSIENCSWSLGAGVLMSSGTINQSTISDNTADRGDGAGLAMIGSAPPGTTVTASTIAGNRVLTPLVGFSLYGHSGGTQLTTCCIADIPPTGTTGPIELQGTVIGSDDTEMLCGGAITSLGYNRAEDTSCNLSQPTDATGLDAGLDPLGDNGGPTPTRMPRPHSFVVDAIPAGTATLCDATTPTDQRGEPRPVGGACDVGAVEAPATGPAVLTLTVNHGGDATDADPGDGTCQDTGGTPGACSLRAAIDESNASSAADTITVDPAVTTIALTRAGANEDGNQTGDLDVRDPVDIDANGATVDAGGLDRALHLHRVNVGIREIEVVDGSVTGPWQTAAGSGAGISQDRGTLLLVDSTLADNTANQFGGGYHRNLGTSWLINTTFSGNQGGNGGAIGIEGGSTILQTSTLAGNTSTSSGSALHGANGTVAVVGSILANTGADCVEAPISAGYNLSDDTSCALAGTGDLQNTSPQLVALADNGGPTRTRLPYIASPAVDAIPVGAFLACDANNTTDQRGEPRPLGPACDIGAVEGDTGATGLPVDLTVTHGGDATDSDPGDGTCQDIGGAPGDCSLRAAIDETNAYPSLDTITIDPAVDTVTLTRAGASDDANQTGDLDVREPLEIDGNGATLDAGGLDRAIHARDTSLDVTSLTITGGTGGITGLGVYATGSAVAIRDSAIIDNRSTSDFADGGGIALNGGNLTLTRSTVARNEARSAGGIWLMSASGTVTESTISSNVGRVSGGGISVNTTNLVITASTISDNVSGGGEAITRANSGTLTIRGSILAGTGRSCTGVSASHSAGYNLGADGTCNLTKPTDQQNTDPLLTDLVDNGGPAITRLPLSGSPARDVIPSGTAGLCDVTTPTDQRGEPRPAGAACDLGATEPSGPDATPLDLTVTHGGDATDDDPGDGTCQDTGGAPGDCSLRAAIAESDAWPTPDAVTVDPGLDLITVTAPIEVWSRVDLDGAGAALTNPNGQRALDLTAADLALADLTVTDSGSGTAPGGAVRQRGGTLTVTDTTITGNVASAGGGIHALGGRLEVRRSTLSGNQGASGAGIAAESGFLVVDDTTIALNLVGPGITSTTNTTTVTAATIVANDGGAITRSGGGVNLAGTILAAAGNDCSGTVVSGGHNLSDDTSCALTQPTDRPSTDAVLMGGLADNGGATQTIVPALGSPALDAIPVGTAGLCDGTATTDQRGVARPSGPACDIGAVEGSSGTAPDALDLEVNHGGDALDATPGDGTCQDAGGAPGACSLRAAIGESNARLTTDTVTIDPAVETITLARHSGDPITTREDLNTMGDLDLRDDTTIVGNGATVDGAQLDRVLHAPVAITTQVSGLTITGGQPVFSPGAGAGILVIGGTFALSESTIEGNHATTGSGANPWGGGIAAINATVSITDTEIADNTAVREGGGVYASGGSLTIERTSIIDNQSSSNGGGLAGTGGTRIVDQSTIARNQGGGTGGVYLLSGTSIVRASTIAMNAPRAINFSGSLTLAGTAITGPGPDCGGAVTSGGFNISDDTSCGLTQPTDDQSTDPLLNVVADNGGPTRTQLPLAGSPAVDAIPVGTAGLCDATAPIDQRGVSRPAGSACDIGAVEGASTTAATPLALTVTHGGDTGDDDPGDGTCQDTGGAPGACSLRAAIDEANHWPPADTITISGSVGTITLNRAGVGEDGNADGDLDILDDLTLLGNGATVDADDIDRVLHVPFGGTHEIADLTLTDGSMPSDSGAGLTNDGGTLTLRRVTITANSQTNGSGGGIDLTGGATTIIDSTISNNVAYQYGGGIRLVSGGSLTLLRSTISGNQLVSPNTYDSRGGGIDVWSGTTATIVNSTIADNVALTSSVLNNQGNTSINGSILEGAGGNCNTSMSGTHNRSDDVYCVAGGVGGNQMSVDSLLGPLADNGGPTPTHLPGLGSPAHDGIPFGTAGLCDGTTPADQRGLPRPSGAACDVGAVERQPGDT